MISNAISLASKAISASTIVDGTLMAKANTHSDGDKLGIAHGAMRAAKGAVSVSGVGTPLSLAMEMTDMGIQALRDAHQMNSEQVNETLHSHQRDFTPEQMQTVSEARRLFRFAKAATPNHPSIHPNRSEDAMAGGHVIVEDGGAMNHRLKAREKNGQYGGDRAGEHKPSYNLSSSQYQGLNKTQSEHQLPSTYKMNFGTALHGTTAKGDSWLQMQAHSGVWSQNGGLGRVYKDYPLQATDTVRQKISKQQVGPLGSSSVSEKQPLKVTREDMIRSRMASAAANASLVRIGLEPKQSALGSGS